MRIKDYARRHQKRSYKWHYEPTNCQNLSNEDLEVLHSTEPELTGYACEGAPIVCTKNFNVAM